MKRFASEMRSTSIARSLRRSTRFARGVQIALPDSADLMLMLELEVRRRNRSEAPKAIVPHAITTT
jgi:hypothetical protein